MINKEYFQQNIGELAQECERIKSLWSGKESGIEEDNCQIASEIQYHCEEIDKLIKEL